jgi:hypothetical protein
LQDALDELRSVMYPMIKNGRSPKQLLDQLLERAENFSEWGVFIGSLSEEHDLLSQWRSYCPDGGVSIGFVFDDLRRIAEAHGFRLMKCIYPEARKQELLKELIEETSNMFSINSNIDACVEFFILHYRTIAPSFKSSSLPNNESGDLFQTRERTSRVRYMMV